MELAGLANLKAPLVGQAHNWTQLKLDTQQQYEWDKTRTAMLWAQPAFTDILYSMMVGEKGEQAWFTDQVQTAGTDDRFLYLNPLKYLTRKLECRIFIGCHEIWHAMMGHCAIMYRLRLAGAILYPDGERLPYDDNTMQRAADGVINAGLLDAKVGEMPEDAIHFPGLITGEISIIDAYRKLFKYQQQQKQNGGGSTINSSKGFDVHMTPGEARGKSPSQAMSERDQQAWDMAITAAKASMKGRGTGTGNLEGVFGKAVEPDIPWQEKLRTTFNRRVGNGRQTWDNLDEEFVIRGIGAPGRIAWGVGRVVVAQDSSGSITQKMSDIFMAATGNILEDARPRELILCQCDDEIKMWEEILDGANLKRTLRRGWGGTDFRPVFNKIYKESLEPDILIFFTDMDGGFPDKAPPFPVIWASSVPREQVHRMPKFGDFLYIPIKGEQ